MQTRIRFGRALVNFAAMLWTVLILAATGTASARAAETGRPNIIVIVGDDMGYGDIGVHGCQDIPTPNLDALAAAGARCTSGYVSGPYCSPTRAGLMTGRYQTRFGHEFNPGNPQRQRRGQAQRAEGRSQQRRQQSASNNQSRGPAGLPLSQTTIADRLKSAGYATALVGKWHLGTRPRFRPLQRGFDEFYGFLGGSHSYFPVEPSTILRGKSAVEEKEYLTDALAREAVDFIDRHRDKPFFLYLAFNAVHTPMHADEDRLKKFSSIEAERRRTYAAMMSAMDDAVGEVVGKLRDAQLIENTLIFFISDNGGPTMPGTAGNGSSNKPLRGSKRTTLEGGVRVPFFVSWSGHVPAGKVYDRPVIQLDIVPTALAAAGVELPADAQVEGVNLLPYLQGESDGAPHDALYWRFGQQMAIRQGDWKLVRYDATVDGMPGQFTEPKLYNLASDIGEANDLRQQEPERATALQAAWDEWNKANVPPLWSGSAQAQRADAARQQPAESTQAGE